MGVESREKERERERERGGVAQKGRQIGGLRDRN